MAQSIKLSLLPNVKVVYVNDDGVSYTLEFWPKMRLVVITPSAPPVTEVFLRKEGIIYITQGGLIKVTPMGSLFMDKDGNLYKKLSNMYVKV